MPPHMYSCRKDKKHFCQQIHFSGHFLEGVHGEAPTADDDYKPELCFGFHVTDDGKPIELS